MSGPIEELQVAIRDRLLNDVAVSAKVGDRIWDGPQSEGVAYPNITFGLVTSTEADVDCIETSDISIQIDVWSQYGAGKQEAAQIAQLVKKSLHRAEIELPVHALVELEADTVQVMSDPDGITSHGIVRVSCYVEEN